MTPTSKPIHPATARDNNSVAGLDLGAVLADGALPIAVAVADQNGLLAGIEARLTQEVGDLANALMAFGHATQSIREELPPGAKFGKLITGFFASLSLQFAHSMLKDRDKPLLLDDGAQYLHQLRLEMDEFVREIDVDGRRFLAVAFIEQSTAQIPERRKAGSRACNP